jgi:hypothetical protein
VTFAAQRLLGQSEGPSVIRVAPSRDRHRRVTAA